MQTPIIWLAVLAVVLDALCSGCTMSRRVRPPIDPSELARVTLEARDRNVDILLAAPATGAPSTPLVVGTTGREAHGSGLVIGVERASWQDALGNNRSVPLAAVREVHYLSAGHPRGRGALQGAGLGFLAGAVTGAIAGLSAVDDKCDPRGWCFFQISAGMKAAIAVGAFGAAGLLAGGLIGAIVGERTTVRFEQ